MRQTTPANYRFKRKMMGESVVCKIGAGWRSGRSLCSALLCSALEVTSLELAGPAISLHIWGGTSGGGTSGWPWWERPMVPGAGLSGQGAPRLSPSPGELRGGHWLPPSPGTGALGTVWGSPAAGRPPTSPPTPPPQKDTNRHKCQGAELIHLIFPSHLIKSRVTFGKSC